jgi:hypothetical protein
MQFSVTLTDGLCESDLGHLAMLPAATTGPWTAGPADTVHIDGEYFPRLLATCVSLANRNGETHPWIAFGRAIMKATKFYRNI